MAASGSAKHGPPRTPDRWLVTALIAAILTAVVVAMVKLWPTAIATWMVGAAGIVFVIVSYLNPQHWLKRRSGTCLGIAGVSAAMPAVAGALNLPQGLISFSTTASPWVAVGFGAFSVIFAWLDRIRITSSGAPQVSATLGGKVVTRDVIRTGDHTQVTIQNAPAERTTPDPNLMATTELALKHAMQEGALSRDVQSLTEENRELKAKLTAALERVDARAEATGDPQARAAIEEAQRSGDLTKLDAALDAEFARREEQIKEQAADWFELCRESAAVAFIRGDIDKAQSRLETILQFFPDDLDAINRLGHINRLRGRLPEAEASYRRVLELAAGDKASEAVAYGNVGIIMQTRGDLDGAEGMHRKSLAIDEKLGRLEGMAIAYGNLGIIMQTRGDLDGAEAMHRKSLAIEEKLGRLEGMASDYGSLGNVMFTRGDLDGAEAMLRQSLAIEEKLGRLDGMANAYGNLGVIMEIRGDLDGAEAMWTTSRDLYARLGAAHMVDKVQGWIDALR